MRWTNQKVIVQINNLFPWFVAVFASVVVYRWAKEIVSFPERLGLLPLWTILISEPHTICVCLISPPVIRCFLLRTAQKEVIESLYKHRFWWSYLVFRFFVNLLTIRLSSTDRLDSFSAWISFKMTSSSPIKFLIVCAVLLAVASASFKKKECDYCKEHWECETNYCYRNKCLWRNSESFNKCFVPLCGDCKHSKDCTTERCYKYKCVPKLNPDFPQCFPHTPTPSPTSTATATATPTKSPIVLKPDCAPCYYYHECSSYKCTDGKCGTPYTVRHCPKDLCAACRKNSDCKSHICYHGKCVSYPHSGECRH